MRIYTSGAFLIPMKIGNFWRWVVDGFEDESFHNGEPIDPAIVSPTREGLMQELYGINSRTIVYIGKESDDIPFTPDRVYLCIDEIQEEKYNGVVDYYLKVMDNEGNSDCYPSEWFRNTED